VQDLGIGLSNEQNWYVEFILKHSRLLLIEIQAKRTAIGFAIVSFYVLDFALNGLQASLRNLLLDVTPPGQLSSGNAWHGRMTNAGNIVGFGFGKILPLVY